MRQKKKTIGFTLIEMMIAISIFSMLLFAGTYSYQLIANRWDKNLSSFSAIEKEAKHTELLLDVLQGIKPFIVTDQGRSHFYFVGDQTSILGVTSVGIFSGQYHEIFRLSLVTDEQGGTDIVYQAKSTKDFLLFSPNQEIIFDYQLVLFDDVERARLAYFGWQNLNNKGKSGGVDRHWYKDYSSVDRDLMPQRVLVEFYKEDARYTFEGNEYQQDTERLLMASQAGAI
jgi:prepilin-type N-terminal cleavage/methylation domain-containing protein